MVTALPQPLSHELAQQLESINGRGLGEGEQHQVEEWQKGRALAHAVNSPGWDVALSLLSSYATNETETLLRTDPVNKEAVLAAHSLAFAAARIYNLFVDDVQHLVMASQRVPEVVKEGLKHSSPVPPESL